MSWPVSFLVLLVICIFIAFFFHWHEQRFIINEPKLPFYLIVASWISLEHNLKSFRLSDFRNDYQLVAARSCFHNYFWEMNDTLGKTILWIQNTTLEIHFVYLVSKDPVSFFADRQLRMIIHIICHSSAANSLVLLPFSLMEAKTSRKENSLTAQLFVRCKYWYTWNIY